MKKQELKQFLIAVYFSLLWFLPPENMSRSDVMIPVFLLSVFFLHIPQKRVVFLSLTVGLTVFGGFLDASYLFVFFPVLCFVEALICITESAKGENRSQNKIIAFCEWIGAIVAFCAIVYGFVGYEKIDFEKQNTQALFRAVMLFALLVAVLWRSTTVRAKGNERYGKVQREERSETIRLLKFVLFFLPGLLFVCLIRRDQTQLLSYPMLVFVLLYFRANPQFFEERIGSLFTKKQQRYRLE